MAWLLLFLLHLMLTNAAHFMRGSKGMPPLCKKTTLHWRVLQTRGWRHGVDLFPRGVPSNHPEGPIDTVFLRVIMFLVTPRSNPNHELFMYPNHAPHVLLSVWVFWQTCWNSGTSSVKAAGKLGVSGKLGCNQSRGPWTNPSLQILWENNRRCQAKPPELRRGPREAPDPAGHPGALQSPGCGSLLPAAPRGHGEGPTKCGCGGRNRFGIPFWGR